MGDLLQPSCVVGSHGFHYCCRLFWSWLLVVLFRLPSCMSLRSQRACSLQRSHFGPLNMTILTLLSTGGTRFGWSCRQQTNKESQCLNVFCLLLLLSVVKCTTYESC